ncbi:MAG: aldehyde dehydrogenase family protein [Bacteroidia bacterium]|nr:aldehyde dehydrogenase family protein [Bacteroidia bacterium]
MKSWGCYLGGEFVNGSIEISVTEKYTDEIHAQVYGADKDLLLRAVSKANRAFGELKFLPSHVRYNECMWVAGELEKRKHDFAINIAKESGKPYRFALAETERAVQVFTVAAEESKRLPKEYLSMDWTSSGKGKEGIVKWFPAGVVAGISPFNFPLNLAVHKVAPALACGCPIVLKPSSLTPTSLLMLCEIIDQTEHIKKMLYVVPTDRKTGNLLIEHPDIRVLSFTGSPDVGWDIKERSGKKKVILELGGNAAVIVDKGIDLEKNLSSFIYGAFAYSGQICIHAQRFIVHRDVYDEFKKLMRQSAEKLKKGNPADEQTDFSVMIDDGNARRVESWVDDALGKKASVLCGHKRDGKFYEPTILENVPTECAVYAEEVFGPVITLEKFNSDEEAVLKANASKFGLQCGVFTNRIDFLKYCFEHLDVGGVVHNGVPTLRFDHMPYGGVKDSGLGREGVAYAIRDYMEPKILIW